MNYYGAKELAAAFRTVRKNTIAAAEEIAEDKFDFRATPETRTVAQTLVHIATGTCIAMTIHAEQKRTTLEGFDYMSALGALAAEEGKSRSKAEIIDLLKSEGDKFASWIETVSDEFLGEVITFPAGMQPPSKSRFEMLLAPKEHEMHHRAQLMLLQRMLGGVPHLTRQMIAFRAQMQAAAAK